MTYCCLLTCSCLSYLSANACVPVVLLQKQFGKESCSNVNMTIIKRSGTFIHSSFVHLHITYIDIVDAEQNKLWDSPRYARVKTKYVKNILFSLCFILHFLTIFCEENTLKGFTTTTLSCNNHMIFTFILIIGKTHVR